jgi:hypothetical protein
LYEDLLLIINGLQIFLFVEKYRRENAFDSLLTVSGTQSGNPQSPRVHSGAEFWERHSRCFQIGQGRYFNDLAFNQIPVLNMQLWLCSSIFTTKGCSGFILTEANVC